MDREKIKAMVATMVELVQLADPGKRGLAYDAAVLELCGYGSVLTKNQDQAVLEALQQLRWV